MSTQRNRQGSVSRACACGRFAMAATARLYRGCRVIAGLALMLSCGDSHAGDYHWANTLGGAFGTAANWSPSTRVPGSADVVYFDINNTYTTMFSASYTNNVAILNTGNLTLDIGSGNTWYLTGEFRGSYIAGTNSVTLTSGNLSVTNSDTTVGYVGNGTLTISNGVSRFKVVYVGRNSGSVGNWNIAGGLVQPLSSVYVGNNSGSRGNLNIAGGTNTLSYLMHIGRNAGSTGTVTITGGSLSVTNNEMVIGNSGNGAMTIANGVAQFKNAYVGLVAGSVGRLTVIGTNAVITCSSYEHRTTNTTLSELFYNGGVSPITCTGLATLSGVLKLGMNGSMGLVTTNAIPLITATSGFSGGFGTTNRSVFAVSKTATKLLATLDSSYRSAGGTLVNNGGLSFSATNQGWVAVSTNGMTGSTFDLNLLVLANNATHTVSDLVSVLKTAGYTATNSVKSGDEWLTLTLPLAAWSNPAFAWDLTGYDSMMSIRTARIGSIPAKGTMVSFL